MSTPGMTSDSRQTLDIAVAISRIPFQNPQRARLTLERLLGSIPGSLGVMLPNLLVEVPDPDSALLLFERLVFESDGQSVRLLEQHNILAHYAITIFGNSGYLGETVLQNPDLLQGFVRKSVLDRSFSREDFEPALTRFLGRSEPDNISAVLARFKRREYVRILLRDALRIAPLAETTAEISALSDVLIEKALREAETLLQRRFGTPHQTDLGGRVGRIPFTIFSLGKLGGNELNYFSDIDLLYLYRHEPAEVNATTKEYFIHLAQAVTETLSRLTPEGPVFRIDLRLRPQGNEGELAVSLKEALRYYAETAQDWERQALIKVRHAAGDATLAKAFIRGVQPYVYRENINFLAIKTALVSRGKMQVRRKRPVVLRRSQPIDIKIDPGGIRDIEFLVQCLQRVYGGAEPWLRSVGTLFSLQKLHDKGHITGHEFDALSSSYDFLRRLEHCLQLRDGQRVHRLPVAPSELRILTRAMNQFWPGRERFNELIQAVEQRMASVAEIYQCVIYQQEALRENELRNAEFQLRSVAAPLQAATDQQLLERLVADSAVLSKIVTRPDLDTRTRRNLSRFLSSAFTSSEQYSAVINHPEAVEFALRIFEVSDYLTDILVRYPGEIGTLSPLSEIPRDMDSACLFDAHLAPSGGSDLVLDYLSTSSIPYSEKSSLLRQQYRHRLLRTGIRDLTTPADIYETLRVNSATADAVIKAALDIASSEKGISVLAMGRLGTCEFDLLSDADLLFVCEENSDRTRLIRVVERVVHTLSAYTREGTVVSVDTRLRPHGTEGELLVSAKQLEEYFSGEAQAWEALMYTKLRFIVGSHTVAERALAATRDLFGRYSANTQFLTSVLDMRSKLERAEEDGPNLKNSPGGIYDIDFIVAYLLVRYGARKTGGNLRERIWRCMDLKILDKALADILDHAAELFRTTEHVVRLVTGRAHKWLPSTQRARELSERLIHQSLGREFPNGVETELRTTMERVRSTYLKIMA